MDRFSHGQHFEERLVQALMLDHQFSEQIIDVLQLEFFTLNHLRALTNCLFDYYRKYRSWPSCSLAQSICRTSIESDLVREQIANYFQKIKKEPLNGDLPYVRDSALEFCRKQSLLAALEHSLELAQQNSFEEILKEIQKAIQLGSDRNPGHVYDKDVEQRILEGVRSPVETPWKPLNGITGGGLSGGEFGVIMALTGIGKSHALVDIGAHAARLGKTVVHYTFELNAVHIGKRYDSNLTNIDFDHLLQHKDEVRKAVKQIAGKIIIKKYPNRQATVLTLRNHINKLMLNDIQPDLVIIDYADLMKSGKQYENKRDKEEAVYEEIKSLADETGLPIWSVCQSNRAGMEAEILTLGNIAECFAKVAAVDLFVTLNRKRSAEYINFGNMFVAKSRMGPDGIKFNALVDTSTSKIDIPQPGSLEEARMLLKYDSEPEEMKSRVRRHMKYKDEVTKECA